MSTTDLTILDADIDATLAAITEDTGARRAAPSRRLEDAARFASIALTALLSGDDAPSVLARVTLDSAAFDDIADDDARVMLGPDAVEIEIRAVPAHVNDAPEELLMPLTIYLAARAYVAAARLHDPSFLKDIADPAKDMLIDALAAPAANIAAARRRLGH